MSEPQVILRHLFNPKVVRSGHTLRCMALKRKARKKDTSVSFKSMFVYCRIWIHSISSESIFNHRDMSQVLLNCEGSSTNQFNTSVTFFFYFFFNFITTQTPSLHYSAQTILHISTEIIKIKHQVSRTTHARCSTTVVRTGRVKRASTHLMQY